MKKIEPFRVVINHSLKKILLIMRIAFVLILLGLLQTQAKNAYSQKTTLSVNFSNTELVKVLDQIENKSDFLFLYNEKLINPNQKVSINVQDRNIEDLLDALLDGTDIEYSILDRKIILTPKTGEFIIQQITVKGRVTDNSNSPLPGVTVVVKGTTNGTITNFDGEYSLSDISSDAILQFSFVGMRMQEIPVAGKTSIDVVMEEDAIGIEEVVAVGFSTQKKVNLTGSVGSVDMKDLRSRPVQNASQMLQGIVPGLNVDQSSGGALDSNPTLNIRGVTTIGDGSTGSPLVLIDGMEGNINAINPQDIESISVLKDASTVSIYGSRAAFGVILVTTKSAETNKSIISYNNNFRFNQPIVLPDMVDSYRFALYFNDAAINVGDTPHFSEERLQNIQNFMLGKIDYGMTALEATPDRWAAGYNHAFDNVDWYDALFKDQSFSQEHNISISKGTEDLSYFVSGNILDQNGLLKISDDSYNRYTTTVKIKSKLNKWLDANFSLRYISEASEKPYYLNNSFYFDLARQGWPVLSLYDPNGYLFSSPSPALNLMDGGRIEKKSDWLYQQVQFVAEPIKGWRTSVELNYRLRTEQNHSDQQVTYNHDVFENPYVVQQDSHVNEVTTKNKFYNMNIYSEYKMSLKDMHHFKFIVGYQNELNLYKYVRAMRNGIIIPDMPVIDLTSGTDSQGEPITPYVYGSESEWATAGFFGRVNYDFKERYLFELNLRYDGTSRFRSDRRWNLFPSASFGWNMAKESFMEDVLDFVNLLKVRGSYGMLGNQNTSSYYPTYQTMPFSTSSGSWLINTMKPNTSNTPTLISTSLTWEKIKSWNIGLDFSGLRNRLSGSFDYFSRKTLDMVGPAPELPVTLGTTVPKLNNTDLETYGFEFMVQWKDRIGSVGYNARFMLSDSQTTIDNYPNETGSLSDDLYRTSQKVGEIWGYETVGIAKSQEEMDAHLASLPNGGQNTLGTSWEAGDIMYRDLNGDGRIDAGSGTEQDPGDMKIIGNSLPRFNYGFDFGVEWKGFSASVMFQGVMKKDYVTDSYYFWGMGSRGMWWSTAFEEHMNYYREDPNHPLGQNIDSYYPRPLIKGASKNQQPQTKYLLNAAFIRLKNLQFGYTLPHSFTSRYGLNNVRFYISGENLWTGTTVSKVFDPETIDGRDDGSVVYPLFKVVSGGLSLTF